MLGTHYEMTIYHYQRDRDRKKPGKLYSAIFDSSTQTDTLRVQLGDPLAKPYQTISVEQKTALKREMYVSFFLARHDPRGDLDQIALEQNGGAVHVCSTIDRALKAEDDWLLIARETAEVLLRLIAQSEVKRVHLALSCPVPLALLIGCALGTHSAITIHNWFENESKLAPVLSLDHLGHAG